MNAVIKRVLTLLLIIAILLSNIQLSFAYNSAGDFNGGGGGNISGTSDPESVSVIHLYHENQGFRVYLVNSQGISVTKTVDFVKYLPWDLTALYNQSKEDVKNFVPTYFNRTGIWMNKDLATEYKAIHYLSGAKTDPEYMWSVTGDNYSRLYKDGSNPASHTEGSKLGIGTIIRKDYTKNPNDKNNIEYVANGKMYTIATLEYYANITLKHNFSKLEFEFVTGSDDIVHYLDSYTGEEVPIMTKIPAAIEPQGIGSLIWTGDYMRNLMTFNPDGDDKIVLQSFVDMKLPNVDGIGNSVGSDYVNIFEFTDNKLISEYNKNSDEYQKLSDEEKKNTNNPMHQTMIDNNLKMAFEPISWGVPTLSANLPQYAPNRWNYFWTEDAIVYGTPTNLAKYVTWSVERYMKFTEVKLMLPETDLLFSDLYGYFDKYNVSFGWMWGLTQKAYHLLRDEPAYGLTAYPYADTDQYSFNYFASTYNKEGWGVMYFSPDLPIINSTPTWDSIKYPQSSYTPGPAPETTNPDGTFPRRYPTEGEEYKKETYPDGKPKDHNFNIVKFYATKDTNDNYTYTDNHTRQQTLHNITLNDEPGYKVDDWFTSSEFKEPNSKSDSYADYKDTVTSGDQSGDSAGTISIPSTSEDNTLYMRLVDEKEEEEIPGAVTIPLYENEISKQVSLSSITPNESRKVNISLPAMPTNKLPSRSYQEKFKQGSNGGWKATYHYANSSLQSSDSNTVAKPSPFEIIDSNNRFTQSAVQGRSINKSHGAFNSKFTVWRGEDRPTLVSYKPEDNNNNKSELRILGLTEGTTPQNNRAITGEKGVIEKVFQSQFTVAGDSDTTLETLWDWRDGYTYSCSSDNCSGNHWKWSPSWHGWMGYSDTAAPTPTTTLQSLIAKKYIYLGKPNTGDKQSSDNNSLEFKIPTKTMGGGTEERAFSGKGTAISTTQSITLYPYTQMKYNTTQNSAWKNVYTLSNYLSTIHNTDFVDLAYSKKNTNSLELNSTQWSTHSRSIKAVGKDNALPGGALHNLSTPDENNTQVALRIFQTVTPDTIQPALQSGYDYYNSNAAQARRDDLINQVTESLSNLSVVQYVNEGITKDLKQLIGGVMVQSSGNQQVFKNTTSTDSKYFFKFAKTQADGGAINIKKSDDITETIYSITSFTNGDVKVYKNGAEMLGISKTEDINKLLSNPELKELDDKTKFFTNFLLAIDRNVGSDGSGQKWYNEAIDSLELHVYTQIFTLGFTEPFSTRSSVLDPKLIGQQDSKSDLYNYDDNSKVRSSVYLTYSKPTNQTQDGVLGTWGEGNVPVILPRLPYLFQSKIFYIPNATVQDLN